MPVSYFRTYTYQPLAYQPQTIPQYQVSSRLIPTVPNSWQRQMPMSPAGPGYGPGALPSQPQPQYLSNIPSSNPNSQMGPNSETPMQQQPSPTPAPQQQQQQQQMPEYNSPPPSTINTPYSAAPQQLIARPQSQYPNTMSLEYASPMNMQSMNMQQLQFVPCMCPVSVTISAQPVPIEKRSDEVTSDSMDSISIVAAPEEKL